MLGLIKEDLKTKSLTKISRRQTINTLKNPKIATVDIETIVASPLHNVPCGTSYVIRQ